MLVPGSGNITISAVSRWDDTVDEISGAYITGSTLVLDSDKIVGVETTAI